MEFDHIGFNSAVIELIEQDIQELAAIDMTMQQVHRVHDCNKIHCGYLHDKRRGLVTHIMSRYSLDYTSINLSVAVMNQHIWGGEHSDPPSEVACPECGSLDTEVEHVGY